MSESNSSPDAQRDRRQFLATATSAVAVGTVAATTGLGAGIARGGVHISSRDTLKLGLIGSGGRGSEAVNQAMKSDAANVELTAVGDAYGQRMKGSLEGFRRDNPDKVKVSDDHVFEGLDAYQKVLDTDVDVVILATPPGFRPLHFEAAINAGKHVFMEKPVAVDAPGVRRILKATELAKQKNLAVQVGLQRRHEAAYKETIGQLQDGAIGELLVARVYWNQGSLWSNARRPNDTEMDFQLRNWLYFNWLSGDHIVEQHIHNLDVINWLANAYPTSARGMGGREVRISPQFGQIFDHHTVEYDYASGLKMISQCRQIPDCWTDVSEHVHGSNGYCDISAGRIFDLKGNLVFESKGARGGHLQEQLDLVRDLAAGVIPNEGEYGAKSTMTAIMGRLATYTGKVIPWDKAFNSNLSLADTDALLSREMPPPVLPLESGEYPVPVPGQDWEKTLDWDADE